MIKHGLLTTPTAVIKAGSSALAKHSAFRFVVNGIHKIKAAADFPALTSTIPNGYMSVYTFLINAAGTTTVVKSGNYDRTGDLDLIKAIKGSINPAGVTGNGLVIVSFLVVDNNTGSTFTGGTTALDVGSLNVYYYDANVLGEQDPAS